MRTPFGVVLALVLGLAPVQSPPPQAAPTGIVAGTVVDATTKKPVSDAVVALRRGGGANAGNAFTPQRVMADARGRFVFTGVPSGNLLLQVTKAGYVVNDVGASATVQLQDGGRVTDVVIPLWKYATISGRITDDLGDPVVGVLVTAHRRVYSGGLPKLNGGNSARTDDRGIYRLSSLTPGEFIVSVPFKQTTLPLDVITEYMATGNANVAFSVTNEISLLGSSGVQQIGNLVLQTPNRSYAPPPAAGGRTMVYPTTFAPGAATTASATPIVVRSGEERTGVDIQLKLVPAVRVSGTVVASSGSVANVALRLMPVADDLPDQTEFAPITALSDATGAFTMLNVPAGQYALRGLQRDRSNPGDSYPPTWWIDESLTVGDSPIADLRLTLHPSAKLSGRIEFEGTKPRPAGDELRIVTGAVSLQTADVSVTNTLVRNPPLSPGVFTLAPASSGRYLVTTAGNLLGWSLKSAIWQGRDISLTPVDIKDADITDVVVTMTDQANGVSGTVRNAQGATASGIAVLLYPTDERAWTLTGSFPRNVKRADTGASGTFSFARLPPGDYWLVAATEDPSTPSDRLPPAALTNWQNPALLSVLSRSATRIHLPADAVVSQDLRVTVIR